VKPRVYLVDDEALALRRLGRLLEGRVEVAGTATDPHAAVAELARLEVDAVFLDIQMPGMTGLELAARLPGAPLVVFTTAHDEYAVKAFELAAVDYLLKPVRAADLERALTRIERHRALPAREAKAETEAAQSRLEGAFPLDRIASRLGDRIQLVELARVTHFLAEDKLTYAVTAERRYVVDPSIADLEDRLNAARFFRIHRSTLVNLTYVDELFAWFGGGMRVRLKDPAKTELPVARDRVRALKQRLGL
jgi:two-component system LytT family response regulator